MRRAHKQLLGRLAPRLDHRLDGLAAHRVRDLLDRIAKVAGRMVAVDAVHRRPPTLPPPEDQVDPERQAGRHVRRLERLAHDLHEEARLARTPRRQRHRVDALAALPRPEVEAAPFCLWHTVANVRILLTLRYATRDTRVFLLLCATRESKKL